MTDGKLTAWGRALRTLGLAALAGHPWQQPCVTTPMVPRPPGGVLDLGHNPVWFEAALPSDKRAGRYRWAGWCCLDCMLWSYPGEPGGLTMHDTVCTGGRQQPGQDAGTDRR